MDRIAAGRDRDAGDRRAGFWAVIARGLLAVAALLTAKPAAAYEDFETTVGGWDLNRSAIYCTLKQVYEGSGQTSLRLVGSALHEKPVFVVMNQKWSAKAGETYKLDVAFDDTAYTLSAVGAVDPAEAGFVFQSDPDLDALFGKARTLRVYLGETPVARLDLTGSGAAIAAFRRCVAVMHAEQAAWRKAYDAEEARDNATLPGVPVDPFAPAPAEPSKP